MNAFRIDKRLVFVMLALWLASLACNAIPTTRINDLRTETQTIRLDSATSADVHIEFGAGELTVGGGSSNLMDGTFRYNVDEWKPVIDYHENGAVGSLTVSQQGDSVPVGNTVTNEWDIQLSDEVSLDLHINTGAGTSELNLNSLELNNLEVVSGAGITHIDLTGNWQHDVKVSIHGGVGEIVVRLPADIGVAVKMDTALVSVETNNLNKGSDGYTNAAYGSTTNTLTMDLQAGVGTVRLEVP